MSSTTDWKYEKLPILTKANCRQWFNQAKTTLEAKDIEYVLTTTREAYAFNGLDLPVDPYKFKAFKKDDANARLIILRGLDEFTQEDVEEMTNTKIIWEHLQGKFIDKRVATGLAILKDLTNYTFAGDQNVTKISDAWNDIKNKRRHLKEINPEVAQAFGEGVLFQILLTSLPEVYTSLADSLMTSYATTDEKLQRLMDKEDTLTKSDSAMAAYKRSFRSSCFLCHGPHLVSQCKYLSKAQAYIDDKRGKRKAKKRQRHRHDSSDSEVSTTSSELSESDNGSDGKEKKTKPFKCTAKDKSKSSVKVKKKDKNGSKHQAHTAINDTSDSEDCIHYANDAVSQSDSDSGSTVDDKEIHAYIAKAKELGVMDEFLARAKRANAAEKERVWDFDPMIEI